MTNPGIGAGEAMAPSAGIGGQLRQDSEAMRAALAEFGLAPSSYDALLREGETTASALRQAGCERASARLQTLLHEFSSALGAPTSDPEARGRAYLALLESVLLRSLAAAARGGKWHAALEARIGAADHAIQGPLGLLTIARMCQDAGGKVSPTPDGPIVVEWQGWRFGLVGARPSGAADLGQAVESAARELRAARMPGLVALDLAGPVCPEQRPLRAVHPAAGGAELRQRLDSLLQQSRADIVSRCDRDYTIGVVGTAFLAVHLVTGDQVAFMTAYRFMSLLDSADPRERKLRTFRMKFGDLSAGPTSPAPARPQG